MMDDAGFGWVHSIEFQQVFAARFRYADDRISTRVERPLGPNHLVRVAKLLRVALLRAVVMGGDYAPRSHQRHRATVRGMVHVHSSEKRSDGIAQYFIHHIALSSRAQSPSKARHPGIRRG